LQDRVVQQGRKIKLAASLSYFSAAPIYPVQIMYAGSIIEGAEIEMITGPRLLNTSPEPPDWPEGLDG